MKTLKITLVTAMLLAVLPAAKAAVITYSATNNVNTVIPDDNATGISSTIVVGTGTGINSLSYVQVKLNISGGFNGDLYAYLTRDNTTAILLNRIGTSPSDPFGSTQAGMNIYLNDYGGAPNVHTAGTLTSGATYGADGRNANPADINAINAAGTGDNLTKFAGQGAAGNWTLFIADRDGGGTATLNSWELQVTEIPEPANVALAVFGGCFAVVQGVRFIKRKKVAAIL